MINKPLGKIKYVACLVCLLCSTSLTFAADPIDTSTSPTHPTQKQELAKDKAELAQIIAKAKKMNVKQAKKQVSEQKTGLVTSPSVTAPVGSGNKSSNAPVVENSSIDDQAFSNVAHNLMPLTPAQIRTLHYMLAQSRKAAAAAPGVPPKPTSSSIVVNLSPGATPPVVRLRAGYVTSLVFVDSTGAPWPITAYDLGDPQAFNIQWDKSKKNNTILVQALAHYNSGNLAVMLKGLDAPVMITLIPGQKSVDYRVDLRIPGIGPNANQSITPLPNSANPLLLNVLDGIPPQGSKSIVVASGNAQAWLLGNRVYLRTRLTVLSPSWIAKMSSADGMKAYELQKTPVILASQRGQIIQINLKGL